MSTLASLPQEIKNAIFIHLTSGGKAAISQTCNALHKAVIPSLYHTIDVNTDHGPTNTAIPKLDVTRLLKRPHYSSHVKVLTLRNRYTEDPTFVWERNSPYFHQEDGQVWDLVILTLYLPNLTQLYIDPLSDPFGGIRYSTAFSVRWPFKTAPEAKLLRTLRLVRTQTSPRTVGLFGNIFPTPPKPLTPNHERPSRGVQ